MPTPSEVDEARRDFARGAFLYLAVNAAHQRNQTFRAGLGDYDPARGRFRKDVFKRLRALEGSYLSGGVSDPDHVTNIGKLAEDMTGAHAGALHEGRYRFCTAQKALNLYLKNLWGANWIAEPPHCPFDNQVITEMLRRGADIPEEWRNWTAVNDDEGQAAYECWVREARRIAAAQGVSLAAWELFVWKPQ